MAAGVADPELPVVSIEDLGILRQVSRDGGRIRVVITPTYSGCPAMETIRRDLEAAFAEHGLTDVDVVTVLAPAWTTDWVTEEGRRKLAEFGVVPPAASGGPVGLALGPTGGIRCPQCGSAATRELSRFGATACKAIWVCGDCGEPFDQFKQL